MIVVVTLSVACQRGSAPEETRDAGTSVAEQDSSVDASLDAPLDASVDASVARDANAASDAATCGDCMPPPSICVDDDNMRWYDSKCGDSGVCEVTSHDMRCDKTGIEPACFQGSCRIIIVR
jgi:hypothetical protein